MKNANNKTSIVYFHIARGGRFYNQGHKTFNGIKNICEVLNACDNANQWTFTNREDEASIRKELTDRNLTNLLELFEKCQDANDFTEFENRTGLDLGEVVYQDCNGNTMITEEEVKSGVGTLDWDGDYDTDICQYISDCDENELMLIIEDDYYGFGLIREYCELHDIKIDWEIFNGNYEGLIYEIFHNPKFDLSEFYVEQEQIN